MSAVHLQAEDTLPVPESLLLTFPFSLAADRGSDGGSLMKQHHPFLAAEGICSSWFEKQQARKQVVFASTSAAPHEVLPHHVTTL